MTFDPALFNLGDGATAASLATQLPGRPAPPGLIERRATAMAAKPPSDTAFTKIGGVACLVASVPEPQCTVLHFHGGGYRMGSAAGYGPVAKRYAAATKAQVIVPDYALAPENPFPAALLDAMNVVSALVRDFDGRPLFVSGDSAGGGLALALASIMIRPLPLAGLALISPWLDLTVSADSFARCAASDVVFSREAALEAAEQYARDMDRQNPLLSPLNASFHGLPPVIVLASSHEVLIDDSLSFAGRLADANVSFTLKVIPEAKHAWPVVEPDSPATSMAYGLLREWIDAELAL